MTGETALPLLLRHLQPRLNPGDYVFCCLPDESRLQELRPLASFREREGLTLVLPQHQAEALGLEFDYRAAWLTLEVHSALGAVGLTAAVAGALAQANISCNLMAGYYHDHLFVAAADGERALAVLTQLAAQGH